MAACNLFQGAPRDEIHREIRLAVVLSHFVDGDDIGMMQSCHHFRLAPKSRQLTRASQPPSPKDLDRYEPVQTFLARLENDTHTSMPDFFKQHVITE
jgi:hypothetical protein